MLVYEKNNKLNISFDNEIKENPDLQIGKSGDKTEILVDGSSNSGLPEYDNTMEGAVLTLVLQPRVLIEAQTIEFDGAMANFNHGFDSTGFIDGETTASITIGRYNLNFTWRDGKDDNDGWFEYYSGGLDWYIFNDGRMDVSSKTFVDMTGTYETSSLVTMFGCTELVPAWVSPTGK